jgi:hypothetical protein
MFAMQYALCLPTSTASTSSTSTSKLPIHTASILHYQTEIAFGTDTTSDNIPCQPWIQHPTLRNSTD